MITYVQGDVTNPIETPAIIAHVVNDVGLFGAGVAGAIANKFPKAQQQYFDWYKAVDLSQGDIKFCLVAGEDSYETAGVWVCHMVSQMGVVSDTNPQPFKIKSLDACLVNLAYMLKCVKDVGHFTPSIHMPRVGMGLGGWKDFSAIEDLINKHLASYKVFVYDFKPEPAS